MTKSIVLIDPFSGGHHEYYAGELALGLKKKHYDVFAIGDATFIETLCNKVELSDFKVIPFSKSKNRIKNEINSFVFLKKAIAQSKKYDADIIHFLTLDKFILPMFFLYGSKLQMRATLHQGYFLKNNTFYNLKKTINDKLEIFTLKRLFNKGLRVMGHSELLANSINNLLQKKMFYYVPYPIKKNKPFIQENIRLNLRNRLDIPQNVFLILVFGGTRFSKGCDLAIRALAGLPDNFHLLIAGKEEYFTQQYLNGIITEQSLEDRVHMDLGFIQDDHLFDYFASSDIVLLPYRKIFSGQSGPLTIAASMDIPVVASDTIVFKEMINKYNIGHVFKAENIQSMIDTIIKASARDNTFDFKKFCDDHDVVRFVEKVIDNYLNQE